MPMVKTNPSHVIVQASESFDITKLVPENDFEMKHASSHPRVAFERLNPDKEDLIEEIILETQPSKFLEYFTIMYNWVMDKYDYWKPIEQLNKPFESIEKAVEHGADTVLEDIYPDAKEDIWHL